MCVSYTVERIQLLSSDSLNVQNLGKSVTSVIIMHGSILGFSLIIGKQRYHKYKTRSLRHTVGLKMTIGGIYYQGGIALTTLNACQGHAI